MDGMSGDGGERRRGERRLGDGKRTAMRSRDGGASVWRDCGYVFGVEEDFWIGRGSSGSGSDTDN